MYMPFCKTIDDVTFWTDRQTTDKVIPVSLCFTGDTKTN